MIILLDSYFIVQWQSEDADGVSEPGFSLKGPRPQTFTPKQKTSSTQTPLDALSLSMVALEAKI